jgi:uncharacterized protein YndB with AHSA1/START domain
LSLSASNIELAGYRPLVKDSWIRLERTYRATPEEIWELWTTPAGIESWWAPDGFSVEVEQLELEPGGKLVYAMTATGEEQIQFMENAGMPLRTVSRKTFTTIDPPSRVGYRSLVDFVPGMSPYEFLTEIELTPQADGSRVVMTMEPLHDEEWTQRLVAGRGNELDNLGRVLEGRRS